MADYLRYREFTEEAEGLAIKSLLEANGIDYEWEDETGPEDYTVIQSNLLSGAYRIKLKAADFQAANELLTRFYTEQLDDVSPECFLYQFTAEELKQVELNEAEWGTFNVLLARRILEDRGLPLTAPANSGIGETSIFSDEIKRKELDTSWLVMYYLLVIVFPLLGIVVGMFLLKSKKTLSDGTQVFAFHAKDRLHGKVISIIGIAGTAWYILLGLYRYLN